MLWFKLPMWQKMFLALGLGIVFGLIFREHILFIKPVGILFIKAIHMIVVPVLFFSIVNAFTAMDDLTRMRGIAGKAVALYAICMMIAATIGMLVAMEVMPGNHLHIALTSPYATPALLSWSDFFNNLIPDNPIAAFSSGNVVQILIFAIFFGIAINLAKETAKPVIDVCRSAASVVIKLAMMVMYFAPYGIFALIACVIGEYGLSALIPLFKFVACVYISCMLMFLFYSINILCIAKQSPVKFFKSILNPLLMAFSTSSSGATLPVTIKCAEEELKIDSAYARFLLPLGTSLNLNGLSVYLSTATIFAANIFGVHLSLTQYVTIVGMIVLTAMGAAAVPGSALIIMGTIQSAVGIPLGAIPLIAGVDRFNDMMQTTTNVAGDLFTTLVIAKWDKKIIADDLPADMHEATSSL